MSLENSARITDAFTRIIHKNIPVGSFINIGAGRGEDLKFYKSFWPEMRALLIDADTSFTEGWKGLKKWYPGTQYAFCSAATEDGERSTATALANEETLGAPLRSIDSLVREFQLPAPYLLKFDTRREGLDILNGARETLPQANLVVIEAYNFKLDLEDGKNLTFYEVCQHMRPLGFRCIDMCEPTYRPGDLALWKVHLIFAREDNRAFLSNSYRFGMKKTA